MKKIFKRKSVKIILLLMLTVFFVKIIVYDTYSEMKKLKTELVDSEKQLSTVFDNLSKMKHIVTDLEKVKQLKKLYSNEVELSKEVKNLICPASYEKNEMKYDLELGDIVRTQSSIQYPFTLEVESSYNYVGDYMEYLESITIPLSIDNFMILPTNHEFDVIKAQFTGTIYLPM